MGCAEQRPFVSKVVEAAEEKLSEASGLFDLANYRFDNLFPQPVPTSITTALDLDRHRHHPRLLFESPPGGFGLVTVTATSAGDVGADASFG
jgi:hypothetical protein